MFRYSDFWKRRDRLGKHLFMFNVCFDMMVVSAIMALLYGLLRTIVRRRLTELERGN